MHYLNGLFLIDKPSGMTSHDVVQRVRRFLSLKAVGHVGTLDPLATGLMGILVGDATKLSDFLRDESKSYQVQLQLGLQTDTLDITGQKLSEHETSQLKPEQVEKAVEDLQGEMELPVPKFSAVKRAGKKMYERARNNEVFEPPLKKMNFYNVQLLKHEGHRLEVQLECTKGSYIRSWVSELGQQLGVGATMTALRRTRIMNYTLDSAIELSDLEKMSNDFNELKVSLQNSPSQITQLKTRILQMTSFYELTTLLPHWKTITVQGRDEKLMLNGTVSHDLSRRLLFEQKRAQNKGESVGIKVLSYPSGQLLSLLEASPKAPLKIRRVFH